MPEDFLHFIWLYQLFEHKNLRTINGETIHVYHPGLHNSNSGPDFSNARINIDSTTWVGNVEIHVRSSDWFLHQHQIDPAYSNVILHVVYSYDSNSSEDKHFNSIPTLELKGRMDLNKYNDWKKLKNKRSWIPCKSSLKDVPSVVIYQMIHRATVDRLQRKVADLHTQNNNLKGHWECLLMQNIAKAMGSKVNKEAFYSLALKLPFQLIKKSENDPELIEAIVFGMAGFLEQEPMDDYPKKLKAKFDFLILKHELIPLTSTIWKFMRMRPMNFPTIRLAQLASILSNWTQVCAGIFYFDGIKSLDRSIRIPINSYWLNHFRFGVRTRIGVEKMGASMFDLLIINAIVPFLYHYAYKHDESKYHELALELLEITKAEKNTIIEGWERLNIKAKNAFESQGLIEMKNNYCSFKKCLSCKVGVWILNSK